MQKVKRKSNLARAAMTLLLAIFCTTASWAQDDELTVYDGTSTSKYVPAFIYYFDDFTRGQFVIPAADLSEMSGKVITSISFYTTNSNVPYTTVSTVDVYLKEVDYTTISAFEPKASAATVYSGTLSIVSTTDGGKMTITLPEPFAYSGGNLLIGIDNTTDAGYKSISFYGQTVSGASVAGSDGDSPDAVEATQRNFIPKTTFTYTEPDPYAKPTGVTVTPDVSSATVAWDGNADSYNVRYRTPQQDGSASFFDDFENGLGNWTIYTDGEAPNTDGWIQYNLSSDATGAHSGNFVAAAFSWSSNVAYNADNWLVTPPVSLDGMLKFWVRTNSGYPDSYEVLLSTEGNAVKDFDVTLQDMAAATGSWTEVSIDLSSYAGQQGYIAIHHVSSDMNYLFVDDFGIYSVVPPSNWVISSTVDTRTELTGLTPNTNYECQVQAVYGGNTSEWTTETPFKTLEENPVPTDVKVKPWHNTADISWTGGANDSYEVKYRVSESSGPASFLEDFENGLDNWTIYTEGEAPQTNGWYTVDPSGNLQFDAYSGSYVASAWSWNSSAYDADNWLVTPLLTFDRKLKFWVRTNSGYPDSYEVLLSTTGNAISDFTVTLQDMAPAPTNGEWNEVSIDLSSYAGQQGYIAIHHVSNDMNYLLVDYFGMYGESVPAGSWVTVPTTDTSVEITGLSSGTTYDYQVFGIKDNTPNEGTPLATFTTLNDNTKVFVADGDWNVDANWTPAGVPTISNPTIICANVAIPSGVVAAANTIEIDGGSVTLKDGGQLKTNTSGLDITIEKAFDANKFYFIGTALSNNINPANITDMVTDETDLYSFDAGELNEWWNYKAYPFTMNPGNGYLYATSTARTISMEGQTWKSNNNALTMSYTYDDTSTDYFNGWMLISNIYPCTGYVTYINSSYQLEDVTFYKMNATGDGYDVYKDVVELAPGEGAFMKVSSSAYVYFSSEDIGLTPTYSVETDVPVLPVMGLDVDQDATPFLALEDADDNTDLLDDHDGKTGCNIVLADRILYKDASWNTLCLPFDLTIANSPLDGDNVQAKTLSSATITGTTLNIDFTDAPATIPAGTPFVIKWDNTGVNLTDAQLVFPQVTINKTPTPVEQADIDFIGSYVPTVVGANGDNTMLYLGADNKLYWPNGAWTLGAQRAYFSLKNGFCATDAEVGNAVKEFNISFGNDATGIMVLNADGKSDGKSGVWYSVDGRRISGKPTMKGVYINKGKKVFAK